MKLVLFFILSFTFLISGCLDIQDPFEKAKKQGINEDFELINKELPKFFNNKALNKDFSQPIDAESCLKFYDNHKEDIKNLASIGTQIISSINKIRSKTNICFAAKLTDDISFFPIKPKKSGYFGTSIKAKFYTISCQSLINYFQKFQTQIEKMMDIVSVCDSKIAAEKKKWFAPYIGDKKYLNEVVKPAIEKAYTYEDVNSSHICVLTIQDHKKTVIEPLKIECVGTMINKYGMKSCDYFSINPFTEILSFPMFPHYGHIAISQGICSPEILSPDNYNVMFRLAIPSCFLVKYNTDNNESNVYSRSGCYIIKDDFNIMEKMKKCKLKGTKSLGQIRCP